MAVRGWTCLQYASLKLDNAHPRMAFCLSHIVDLLAWSSWNKVNNTLVLRPAIVCALDLQRLFVKVDYVVIIVVTKAVVGRRADYTGRSSLKHVLLPYGCSARTLSRK